jgi:hypothetical protein
MAEAAGKHLVVTIVYSEDLVGGWDVFYTEKGVQKKETFYANEREEFGLFVSNLMFTQFGVETVWNASTARSVRRFDAFVVSPSERESLRHLIRVSRFLFLWRIVLASARDMGGLHMNIPKLRHGDRMKERVPPEQRIIASDLGPGFWIEEGWTCPQCGEIWNPVLCDDDDDCEDGITKCTKCWDEMTAGLTREDVLKAAKEMKGWKSKQGGLRTMTQKVDPRLFVNTPETFIRFSKKSSTRVRRSLGSSGDLNRLSKRFMTS